MEEKFMKKIIYILIASAAMFSVAVSCAKEEQLIEDTAEQTVDVTTPAVPATISVSIPEEGLTKVGLEQDSDPDGVVKLTWTSSDFITVKNAADESKSVDFTYVSGAGSATATFSADDISALDGATSYNVYLSSNLPADYSNQTQASDGSTAHLGYSAKLAGVNTYDGATFSQTWATANGSGTLTSSSVLRIRAQLPTADIADAVRAVIIKADKDIFNGKDSIRVEITTPEVAGDSKIVTVYATLPPGDVSEATTTKLLFQFQKSANGNDRLTAYRELATLSLNSGSVNAFKINCPNIASYANPSTTNIGQSTNPYLIGDQNQLAAMDGVLSATKTYFKLVDNIIVNGWTSLSGSSSNEFVFDGNNKTVYKLDKPLFTYIKGEVKNLSISGANIVEDSSYWGILVRTVSQDCEISNVNVDDSHISATTYVGGLVGRTEGSNTYTISDCSVSNTTVSGSQRVGGIIGNMENGTIERTYTLNINVSFSAYYAGGIVGYMSNGTVEDGSYSTGSVVSTKNQNYSHAGGLIGKMDAGIVQQCHSTVSVSGKGNNDGGLIGSVISGTIDRCYATGSVTSTRSDRASRIGGLVGSAAVSGSLTIENCYCNGPVSGTSYCSGFIGYCSGSMTVTNSYTSSSVTCTDPGALVGNNAGTISGTGFIAWWESGNMVGTGTSLILSPYYLGTSGTILSQAQAFTAPNNWDFTTVWNEVNPPTLR